MTKATHIFITIVFVLFCIFFSVPALAELSSNAFKLSVDTPEHNYVRIDEIDKIITSDKFTSLEDSEPSVKRSPWLKIEWDKSQISDEIFIINDSISQAYEDFYFIKDNKLQAVYSGGYTERFDVRPITHFKFAAEVKDADYILVKTCCNPSLPVYFRMLSESELTKDYYHGLISYSILYSIILMMILYNFFIYLFLRDEQYIYYGYYLGSMVVLLLTVSGVGKQFIWFNFIDIETFYFFVSINASIASMLFQMAFLDKKLLSLTNKRLMQFLIFLHVFIIIMQFVHPAVGNDSYITIAIAIAQVLGILGLIVTDYVIIRNIMAGDNFAKILLFNYVLMNISGAIFILYYNGSLSVYKFASYVIYIVIVIEALTLSLALAQKIQRLREGKFHAEQQQLVAQKQFAWQLLTAQEEEKKQLGSALHDNFTHQLLILKTNIGKKIGQTSDEIKHVDKILNEMRNLSHLIHPYLLEKLGLIVALDEMITKLTDSYQLDINMFSNEIALNKEQSLIIYRIIQESLHNVIKHAEASECLIAMRDITTAHDKKIEQSQTGQLIEIRIKDDGIGFDTNKTKGMGLITIQERCQMLSGTLKILSNDNGTELNICFLNHTTKT